MKITYPLIGALALLLAAGCASRPAQGGSAEEEEAGGYTTGQYFGQEELQPPLEVEAETQSGLYNYLEILSDPGPF